MPGPDRTKFGRHEPGGLVPGPDKNVAWIGFEGDSSTGLGSVKYADAPFVVVDAKNAAFSLPVQAMEFIPHGGLPVTEFCALELPRISSELVYGESQMWFSKDEPTTDISLLKGRNIPPQAVLDLLGRKSGQAWLDGAKSISDPRYNDGADRFALGALAFWKEMTDVIKKQATWKRSVQWVENEEQKCKDGK
ncbi:hypothetical protein DFH06DRAFT_1139376 [Mycena polygramma]|nr:hypothetical protein DFH06DRAFT_1139376 [Mycena polygramma]